ncbi:hypothetical protein [Paenibacillus sp. YIM B09110]|uniref:hypothetical protein n=1 Tax=Paenibacillus sp. YIM B09110 TaxID=3126102 RepID=UPI00301C0BE3
MFKRVENELELAMFNGIWTTVWREKGFELEFSDQSLAKIVILTDEGHYVGTTEFKSYSISDSQINETAPFHEHPDVIASANEIVEIDKMAILRTYRGRYISDLLSACVYFAESERIKYFVSLLEPVFLRALKVSFQIPLKKLGEKIFYKGDYVNPVLIDVAQIYQNKNRFEWVQYPQDALGRRRLAVE